MATYAKYADMYRNRTRSTEPKVIIINYNI